MIICADDSTVVKKGVYGKIMKLETSSSGQQIGHIQWELPNPKGIPGTPLPVEVVNLDAQFKYIVEEDPADVHIAHVQLRSCQLDQVLRSACARRTVLRERGVRGVRRCGF